jgi:CBS domain-containing protein
MSASFRALLRGTAAVRKLRFVNNLSFVHGCRGDGCKLGLPWATATAPVANQTVVPVRCLTNGSGQGVSSTGASASASEGNMGASSSKRGFRPRTILRSQTPVGELIRGRGERVYQIAADDTMHNALKKMFIHNIGSLLVVEQALQDDEACKPVGIITERDLTRLLISRGSSGNVSAGNTTADLLVTVKVHEFMTKANALISVTPDTDLASVLELMASRRLRHLPVVRDSRAIGMVSIGDVVRRLIEESREEADALKEYIAGTY